MSILVLGAGGQVGREIAGRLGEADHALTHSALDITRPDAIARALDRHHPKVLINAAAYTAVDRAEAEPDRAEAINRDGAAHLATACAQRGIALLHLSTDYVFDGRADSPYTPADAVNPLGQYGRSKAAGEAAIRQA
ncbi:MAG: NAD(P)-dependent oxidoreductase, partial [Gammaproteobacteria bacterium]|nr:NAD(P)-dependent oxidoreductase [Gammaproteobacteria bacterium]